MGNNQNGGSKFTNYIRATRIARLIIIFLLILFVLGMLIFGSKYLTKQNFQFLSNYMSMQPFLTSNDYKDFKYDNVLSPSYYEYDNKIVIKGEDEIAIFNLAGNLINTIETKNKTNINCDGNYICLFEENNNIGYIYNAFFKVQDIVLPENEIITSITSDKEGNILVISNSGAYRTNLRLYSNSFGLIYEWKSFDKYTIKASVNERNNQLCILSNRIDNGLENTVLSITSIKTGKVEKVFEFDNEKPISTGFLDKNIFILTDKKLTIYNDKYYKLSEISVDSLVNFRLFDTMICLVTKDGNNDYIVCALNKDGTKISSAKYQYEVCGIRTKGDNIYVLDGNNNIIRQYKDEKTGIYTSSEPIRNILIFNGDLVICTKDGCEFLKNNQKGETNV